MKDSIKLLSKHSYCLTQGLFFKASSFQALLHPWNGVKTPALTIIRNNLCYSYVFLHRLEELDSNHTDIIKSNSDVIMRTIYCYDKTSF